MGLEVTKVSLVKPSTISSFSPTTHATTTATAALIEQTTEATTAELSSTTQDEKRPATAVATLTKENLSTATAVVTPQETSTTSTATTPTTAAKIKKKRLTFRSAGETFTTDLENPSSTAFLKRAELIKLKLEPFFQRAFPSFISITVILFSKGSIINTMDLSFNLTSVPSNMEIAMVLINAKSNITEFNVDIYSISVDGEYFVFSTATPQADTTIVSTIIPVTTVPLPPSKATVEPSTVNIQTITYPVPKNTQQALTDTFLTKETTATNFTTTNTLEFTTTLNTQVFLSPTSAQKTSKGVRKTTEEATTTSGQTAITATTLTTTETFSVTATSTSTATATTTENVATSTPVASATFKPAETTVIHNQTMLVVTAPTTVKSTLSARTVIPTISDVPAFSTPTTENVSVTSAASTTLVNAEISTATFDQTTVQVTSPIAEATPTTSEAEITTPYEPTTVSATPAVPTVITAVTTKTSDQTTSIVSSTQVGTTPTTAAASETTRYITSINALESTIISSTKENVATTSLSNSKTTQKTDFTATPLFEKTTTKGILPTGAKSTATTELEFTTLSSQTGITTSAITSGLITENTTTTITPISTELPTPTEEVTTTTGQTTTTISPSVTAVGTGSTAIETSTFSVPTGPSITTTSAPGTMENIISTAILSPTPNTPEPVQGATTVSSVSVTTRKTEINETTGGSKITTLIIPRFTSASTTSSPRATQTFAPTTPPLSTANIPEPSKTTIFGPVTTINASPTRIQSGSTTVAPKLSTLYIITSKAASGATNPPGKTTSVTTIATTARLTASALPPTIQQTDGKITTLPVAEGVTKKRLIFRSVQQKFTADLGNSTSEGFINRAKLINTTLKAYFHPAFPSFLFLTVISFSNGSIINTMDLSFNSISVPTNLQIATVLINAALNITAFDIDKYSLTVDGQSFLVAPTTATTAATTTELNITTSKLTSNRATLTAPTAAPTATIAAPKATTAVPKISSQTPTNTSEAQTTFSPAAESALPTNSTLPTKLPTTPSITTRASTLLIAVPTKIAPTTTSKTTVPITTRTTTASPNTTVTTFVPITATTSTKNPLIAANTTKTTPLSPTKTLPTTTETTPKTITTATTTSTTKIPPPVFLVTAVIMEPFDGSLLDKTSSVFIELAARVVATFNIIYRAEFGSRFFRSFVTEFRSSAVRVRVNFTQVIVGVEFRNNLTSAEVPKAREVEAALIQAVNSTVTYNVSLQIDSIKVIGQPTINTTAALTSNSTNTGIATTTTIGTTPTTVLTSKPTTTTTTAATTKAVKIKQLIFRSVGETFTTDMLNTSSAAFTQRALLIKTTLEPYFQRAFTSFISITVTSFRNGSIYNTMDLRFEPISVPTDFEVASVLMKAAPNITAFNIDLNSITVDGTEFSHGVRQKISLVTAFCMVMTSWLLSSQQ